MRGILKDNRGIALMMVLGSILILSTMVVEFAYNTHVSYDLASSQRDRLKAYYLARSAYNLTRLELKYERDMRARYANMLKDLKGSGVTADPLCKQIPFSTGLLKGITSGALFAQGDEGGEEGGEEKKEEKPKEEKKESGNAAEGAEDFLDFDGDFEVTCDTEERKINLNVFRADPLAPATGAPSAGGLPSTPAPSSSGSSGATETLSIYDSQKELLVSLLTQKDFDDIFKGKPDEARKVVNFIADWADRDDRVNESPGMAGGAEDSEYSGKEYHYKVKNGKYATVAELLLVAGVGDDLYSKLEPQITVYGDNKINICQASDEMVKAFVLRYIQTNPGTAPINPKDDEKWESVVAGVKLACSEPSPTPDVVAQALAGLIGASSAQGIKNQIVTTNRYFRIESTGTVGESHSKIVAIIDAGAPSPNLWKTLYFRVE